MKRFVLLFLILSAFSCTKIYESPIPWAHVYLQLDLRFEDRDLIGPTRYKVFTSGRKAGESVGYAGIVVICGLDNNYYAFDLCCPHERSATVRIEPNEIGQGICPQCHTVYDLGYGTGAPTQGVSRSVLRRYAVQSKGERLIIIN